MSAAILRRGYALRSVNSMLASVNHFLRFMNLAECRVRFCKVQREIYQPAGRELTKDEYLRLLHAAKSDRRLWLLLQTICATGIRVSELRYFTVCAVRAGEVFPHNLRKLFARTFYTLEKDIAKLADVLGHSSINTTRIDIMTTGVEHRRQIERLGFLDAMMA